MYCNSEKRKTNNAQGKQKSIQIMKTSISKEKTTLAKSLTDKAALIPKGKRNVVIEEIHNSTRLGKTAIFQYLNGGVAKVHTGQTILAALTTVLERLNVNAA